MNTHLRTNDAGIRLITGFEGKPRLKARMCEGGAWEVGYGNTFDENGIPFKEGDTIPPERVIPLFRNVLRHFEDGVRLMLTVEVTPNQFSALVSFAYNVGLEALRGSTVLRMTNLRRWEDAAAAFGMWIFATKNDYKQAYRGLLRRRYAEACLFLGYDWTVACSDDAIALQKRPPASIPGADSIIYKTPFHEVLAVAYHYPLPSLEDDDFFDAIEPPLVLASAEPSAPGREPVAGPGPAPATQPERVPVPASSSSSSPSVVRSPGVVEKEASKAGAPVSSPPTPVGTKPKSANTVPVDKVPYRIDPNAGLKPLDESERAKGYVIQQVGIGVIRLGALGCFGTTAAGVSQKLQSDTVLSNLVLMVFVAVGIAVTGYVIKAWGDYKRKKGEREAIQGLY